jgi:hypothetical protein
MPDPTIPPTSPHAAASAAIARLPKFTFTIPEEERGLDTDPKTITIRELTYGEEQQAQQAASAHGTTVLNESAMRSVVAADDKPVTWENDGKERFYQTLSNKARELLMQAFVDIALPKPEGRRAFLASRKTTL